MRLLVVYVAWIARGQRDGGAPEITVRKSAIFDELEKHMYIYIYILLLYSTAHWRTESVT